MASTKSIACNSFQIVPKRILKSPCLSKLHLKRITAIQTSAAEHPSVTVVNDLSFNLLLRIAILVNGQQRIVLYLYEMSHDRLWISLLWAFLKVNELEEDGVKEYLIVCLWEKFFFLGGGVHKLYLKQSGPLSGFKKTNKTPRHQK